MSTIIIIGTIILTALVVAIIASISIAIHAASKIMKIFWE